MSRYAISTQCHSPRPVTRLAVSSMKPHRGQGLVPSKNEAVLIRIFSRQW